MLSRRALIPAVMIVFTSLLSACATSPSTDPADRHQHMRDAKQGATMPYQAPAEDVRKPLHDHREMK